jgi:hypothetical protein
VLGCRLLWPSGLGFLYQRFSSPVRNEACLFRNQQSRTAVKFGDHSSIRDSWPMAFSGYPRGPRVGCETVCPFILRLWKVPRDPTTISASANSLSALHREARFYIASDPCMKGCGGGIPLIINLHVYGAHRQTGALSTIRLARFVASAALIGALTQMARRGPRSTAQSSQNQCARRAGSFGRRTWSCNAIRRL